MSNHYNLQLIDYLDNNLPEQEMRAMAALIESDPAVKEEWEYMQKAVQAVQHNALHEQVGAVKEQYLERKKARVRKMRVVFSMAAVFVLLITGIAVKYVTTSATDIYKDAYASYNLNTSRSSGTVLTIEQAYRDRKWKEVIAVSNTMAVKDNEAWFLAGMANLELQQYASASQQFEQVLLHNAQTGDNYFQDEAEYYLALSYLAQNKVGNAVSLLKKIKADASHLYNKQAREISGTDLKISSFKSDK